MNRLPFLLFWIWTASASGQTFSLKNPSFEGLPMHNHVPDEWVDCSGAWGVPADVQPGFFDVEKKPQDGKSCLGLLTYDNGTWESVSQKLTAPLEPSRCYSFSVQLARSPHYAAYSFMERKEVNANVPIVFQVWGGDTPCSLDMLLAESPAVEHSIWRPYRFIFCHYRTEAIRYITFQAYYSPENRCPYNGNVLVDAASEISLRECPAELANQPPPVPAAFPIESATAFDSLLHERWPQVEFVEGKDFVDFDCIPDATGMVYLDNLSLGLIVKALKTLPDKSIRLRVKENGSKNLPKNRAAFFQNYFAMSGLTRRQADVEVLSRRDFEKDWMVVTKDFVVSWK